MRQNYLFIIISIIFYLNLQYLNCQLPETILQTQHFSKITSLIVTKNNKYIISGDESGNIKILDIKNKMVIKQFYFDGYICYDLNQLDKNKLQIILTSLQFESDGFTDNKLIYFDLTNFNITDSLLYTNSIQDKKLITLNYDGKYYFQHDFIINKKGNLNKICINIISFSNQKKVHTLCFSEHQPTDLIFTPQEKLYFIENKKLIVYDFKKRKRKILKDLNNNYTRFNLKFDENYFLIIYCSKKNDEFNTEVLIYDIKNQLFEKEKFICNKSYSYKNFIISNNRKYLIENITNNFKLKIYDLVNNRYIDSSYTFGKNPLFTINNRIYSYSEVIQSPSSTNHSFFYYDYSSKKRKIIKQFFTEHISGWGISYLKNKIFIITNNLINPIKVMNIKDDIGVITNSFYDIFKSYHGIDYTINDIKFHKEDNYFSLSISEDTLSSICFFSTDSLLKQACFPCTFEEISSYDFAYSSNFYLGFSDYNKNFNLWKGDDNSFNAIFSFDEEQIFDIKILPYQELVLLLGINNLYCFNFETRELLYKIELRKDDRLPYSFSPILLAHDYSYIAIFYEFEWKIFDIYSGNSLELEDISFEEWFLNLFKGIRLYIKYGYSYAEGVINVNRNFGDLDLVKDINIDFWRFQNGCLNKTIFKTQDFFDTKGNNSQDNFDLGILPLINNNYIIYTDDNYYSSSLYSYDAIAFRIGNRSYPFEQFDLRLNRPDIVLKRLGYASKEYIDTCYKAYQLRMKMMGVDTTQFQDDFRIPELKIVSEYENSINEEKLNIKYYVKAVDDTSYIQRINVIVNNVPIFGMKGKDISSLNIVQDTLDLEIELTEGENEILISAFDNRYVESLREIIKINCSRKKNEPDLYMITIGVNDYDDFKDLKYAEQDCKVIDSLFSNQKDYDKIYNYKFVDTNATKEKILAIKDKLLKTKVEDVVILFLSGHGTVYNDEFYYTTKDAKVDSLKEKALSFPEIISIIDSLPARRKLVMIDACNSGEAYSKEFLAEFSDEYKQEILDCLKNNPQANNSKGVIYRSATKDINEKRHPSSEKCDELFESFNPFAIIEKYEELFVDLSSASGAVVITASRGNQFAAEDDELGNGAFTYFVKKGLSDKKKDTDFYLADIDDNNEVTAVELLTFVKEKIKQSHYNSQSPTLKRSREDMDFVIFK